MDKIQQIVFQDDSGVGATATIRCDVCKNFLSVSPILYNTAIGSICGRENCAKISKSKGHNYRQIAYETLARYLKFPCMYKDNGCCEQLNWNEIGEHEKVCEFDTFLCPFSTHRFQQLDKEVCPWTGVSSGLLEHMQIEHQSQHKFENHVQLDLFEETDENQLFFTTIHESIVILLVVTGKNSLQLKVWTGPEIWRNITYKIRIQTKRKTHKPIPKMQTADLIHPTFFKQEVNNTWLTIDFNYIRKIFNSAESLIVEFYSNGILTGPPRKLVPLTLSLPIDEKECYTCQKKLTYPYAYCTQHYICYDCFCIRFEKNSHSCFSCGNRLYMKKRTNIDSLNFFIDHSFITCSLCSEKIDCFSSHLYNSHIKSILQLNKYYSTSLSKKLQSFFSFDDHIFVLSMDINETDFNFSIQCLESRKIKYEFELRLKNLKKSRCASMGYNNFCIPGYIDLKNIPDFPHSSSIPIAWLKTFIPFNEEIDFKLTISKI